jgi:hypothetical protein
VSVAQGRPVEDQRDGVKQPATVPTIVKVVVPSGSVPAPKKLHVVVAFRIARGVPLGGCRNQVA